jgi:RNA polymerase sigma-70 factor, ECF subfamily
MARLRPHHGRSPPSPGAGEADRDDELLDRLRVGDERAFVELAGRYHATMLRIAHCYVSSTAVAEEVVQDAWLGVLRGLDGFAGRSSFRTWLLAILVNRARTTGVREQRTLAVGDTEVAVAVAGSRFDASGGWSSPPRHWVEDSDERLLAQGLSGRLQAALAQLPERQREVVMLRDVDGLGSDEVCEALDISQANQRVLLHRGRSRLRQAIEEELAA